MLKQSFQNRCCCLFLALVTCVAPVSAEDVWPQWRGPSRDGYASGATWPERIDESRLKLRWRVPLGASYSGPIIDQARVYVTETSDNQREAVRALDRRTGTDLWKVDWPAALEVIFIAKSNGNWIRATPALDRDRLYIGGMVDHALCLDTATGKQVWDVDFLGRFNTPKPQFGYVASPLVLDDGVLFYPGGGLCKLNQQTGELIWRALPNQGGAMDNVFASPIHATLCNVPQIIVQSRSALAGIDPATGDVLWSHRTPAFQETNVLTPTVIGDRVFTSAYGGGSILVKISNEGGIWKSEQVWKSKVQGYMSTPVVVDDSIYLYTRHKRFTCLDVATGEPRWTTTPYGEYWSLVVQADKIMALDERGDLLLIRANPKEFELLDQRHLTDDSAWGHLAVTGNEVFVRELNALAVYEWTSP